MIEAAERLFARRGIAAVSLREIRVATGQRNTAAVYYHFGSKAQLVQAILDYRMARIDQERLRMLDALDAAGRGAELRALVEATFCPFAAALKRGSSYARFLAQALGEAPYSRVLRGGPALAHDGIRRVRARIENTLAAVPPALREKRVNAAWGMWIQTMAAHERELESRAGPAVPTAALASDFVDMIVAMLSIPVSAATRRCLKPV